MVLSAGWLSGQTAHKDKAEDYPTHATVGAVSIGADYLVHSIPAGNQTFITSDYLVVEVAVFPGRVEPFEIGNNTFGLRLNQKKAVEYPVAPGFVAASIKYPDWEPRKNMEVDAGMGNAGVILGRPPVVGRFPGDPTPDESRLPRNPKAPTPGEQNGVDQQEPESADAIIAHSALPSGPTAKPVSGFIYFYYKGKIKSLKSVDLVFESKAGSATLKLM